MPPKKRARVSQATSPTPTAQAKTPTSAEQSPVPEDVDKLNDRWTDDEEIGLFKGLITWKPTGIHKHFRLLQLRQYLLENDYIHRHAAHTRPEGIWLKLRSLYDLKALDEREDARQLSDLSEEAQNDDEDEDESDVYSVAANKIHNEDFSLPDHDEHFAQMKWTRRFADEKEKRNESPPELPEVNLMTEPPVRFTPHFSVELSEAPTPPSSVRGKGRGRGRGVARAAAATRRSTRQVESSSVMDEQEDKDDADVGEEEDEESGEQSESQGSTPAPRSTRAKRGGRGGARGRGRGRERGRAR